MMFGGRYWRIVVAEEVVGRWHAGMGRAAKVEEGRIVEEGSRENQVLVVEGTIDLNPL